MKLIVKMILLILTILSFTHNKVIKQDQHIIKKKQFTNLIIIDASGSMENLKEEVRSGIKDIFKNIRMDAKEKNDVVFNTIVLDFSGPGDVRLLVEGNNVDELKNKLADAYETRGMTALYDAIGIGFSKVNKEQEGVFVNILTDGQENSSQEYSYDDIRSVISQKKEEGWAITFMGTTVEALSEAKSWGIPEGNISSFEYSKKGMKKVNKMRGLMSRSYFDAKIQKNCSIDIENLAEEAEKDIDNSR